MLQKLYIRNYAIIDELCIEFDAHLNVLTGETGAGKSIIVGALSLILGDRADTSVLINKKEKCIVEAIFNVKGKRALLLLLEAEGLDADDETIIRREISASGKSRAFINDTPINLSTLNKITDALVDLHRQFDQYLMRHGAFMYDIIDAVAGNQDDIVIYQSVFRNFQKVSQEYDDMLSQITEWQREADYKQFLYEELNEADFKENEIETIEVQLQKLNHAEQILQAIQNVHYSLEVAEPAINQELRRLTQQLEGLMSFYPTAAKLSERIESTRLELKDIAEECETLGHDLALNPDELVVLQDRLDLGYRLLKKHQAQTTEALLAIADKFSKELLVQENAGHQLDDLKLQKEKAFKDVNKQAQKIHHKRVKEAPIFAKEVNRLLHSIGLPNAQIKIEVTQLEECNEQGYSRINFLWDANKNGLFLPIQKSASGGELSRIMLCIKTLTAEAISLPTLIFDEVDTGVSGEAARQVGILLQKLSRRHQVLCITHQPQVAGRGNRHFYVYKDTKGQIVNTHIRTLKSEERILAVAQMIGGESPSDAALKNAREMVVPLAD